MVRHDTHDAVPAEIGFCRQQVLAEVRRDQAARNIVQASQYQNPRKEEMIRPVPNRGAEDERNGKINEGWGSDSAGFAPVQPRMRYKNAYAADKQANHTDYNNPVGDTNDRKMTRPDRLLDSYFKARFA